MYKFFSPTSICIINCFTCSIFTHERIVNLISLSMCYYMYIKKKFASRYTVPML